MNSASKSDSLPALSIVIPAYNAEKTLELQLESLAAQEYAGEWEAIVADNGSTDRTPEIVQAVHKKQPRIRLLDAREKQGSGFARNAGVKAARGEALVFIDADDLVAPGWLTAMGRALKRHDFVVGAIELHRLNAVTGKESFSRLGSRYPYLDFLPFAIGCNTGVRRSAFDAVGGFSEDFARSQDVEFSWRLQVHGYPLHDVPEAVVHYRYRDSLRGIFWQTVAYGREHPRLFLRYRAHGMPRPSFWDWLRRVRRLVRWFPPRGAHSRQRWVREFAFLIGRAWGAIECRTFFL
jgi:GT2 family glycosyltransferase